MARNFNHYSVIVCDIDNTLVYGFLTDLMDFCWKHTKSVKLSNAIAMFQAVTGCYKINRKLRYILNNYKGRLIIMTARNYTIATHILLTDILERDFELIELVTNNPAKDKVEKAKELVPEFKHRLLLFDDKKETRWAFFAEGYHAIDPYSYREDLINDKNN